MKKIIYASIIATLFCSTCIQITNANGRNSYFHSRTGDGRRSYFPTGGEIRLAENVVDLQAPMQQTQTGGDASSHGTGLSSSATKFPDKEKKDKTVSETEPPEKKRKD